MYVEDIISRDQATWVGIQYHEEIFYLSVDPHVIDDWGTESKWNLEEVLLDHLASAKFVTVPFDYANMVPHTRDSIQRCVSIESSTATTVTCAWVRN
jgi:hypothetical protein